MIVAVFVSTISKLTKEPLLLSKAFNLKKQSIFARNTIKEMLCFLIKKVTLQLSFDFPTDLHGSTFHSFIHEGKFMCHILQDCSGLCISTVTTIDFNHNTA